MSLSNASENDALEMFLKGVDPSWRAGATQYAALVTGAENEAAPVTNECTYTGYARVALTKATAWTDNGDNFTNAAQIQWGKRTDAGATQTATQVVIVDTPSGAINMAVICPLSANLDISQNIRPQVDPGDLTITAT
jgi:hypothetical protein